MKSIGYNKGKPSAKKSVCPRYTGANLNLKKTINTNFHIFKTKMTMKTLANTVYILSKQNYL